MTPLEAARLGDQIGHTSAMKGLLMGLVAGFVITGAVLLLAGATVATGGAAAVVVGALIAGTAGGGLAGMKIGATFESDPKGPILTPGSPNTFIGTGEKPAARATLDSVACLDHSLQLIAQGSLNVFINKAPAARKTDKTVCSGKIRDGQPDVFFGGPTGTYLEMQSEVPGWLVTTLEIAMWVGAGIATGGAILTVGFGSAMLGLGMSLAGGWAGGKLGGAIGEAIGGERGRIIGEEIGGFGGAILGGWAAGKMMPGKAAAPIEEGPIAPREVPTSPKEALNAPKETPVSAPKEAPVAPNEAPTAPKENFATAPKDAPPVRPDTSAAKYGPDSKYKKADGNWDWPPNEGFGETPQPKTLQEGTRIDRFGHEGGTYLSPEGTPFPERALAPKSVNDDYHVYKVLKPFEVQAGKIAPAFDQPGGGVQYKTDMKVAELLKGGYIEEIFP